MKIKNTLFLLFISSLAFTQSNGNKYEVLYHFIYQKDSTDIYSTRDEEMILFTDGEKSLYQSYVLYQMDSLMQKDLDNEGENAMALKVLGGGYPRAKIYNKLEKDFKNKKYIQKRKIRRKYYRYPEDFNLKWKIYNDSIKDYHGMKTILATTQMGGRDYKVWFCPDIPIPDGPYKFQGLPGLVVRAIDTDGYFEFNLDAIRKVPEFHYKDYNPLKRAIVETTKEEYKKAKEYYDKNRFKIYEQRGIIYSDEQKRKIANRYKKNNLKLEKE